MVTLNFTLTPEAAEKVHGMIVCLGKFSESVSIEARRERLSFTALNSSKSAYALFALDASRFFSDYEFVPDGESIDGRFTCRMLNKALLSVFKGRLVDSRGRDTAIDRCEVSLQDKPDQTSCRFVVRMICYHGVTKTYRLTYESVEIMHALFDQNAANNRWSIRSSLLKEFIEYFGPKTEQLDIYSEGGRVTFTSFTEKITNSKQEILKHPLQTSVSVNTTDFDSFRAQENMHIIISVKDFKAIVTHADTLDTTLTALYTHPTRPLQFSYGRDGLHCEFTMMTSGDFRGTTVPNPPTTHAEPSKAPSRAQSVASGQLGSRGKSTEMPPPAVPSPRSSARLLKRTGSAKEPSSSRQSEPVQEPAEPDSETLFVPPEEDDRLWDPRDYREDEEVLGWDASADNDVSFHPTFRDTGPLAEGTAAAEDITEGLAPTQRVSQIRGALW